MTKAYRLPWLAGRLVAPEWQEVITVVSDVRGPARYVNGEDYEGFELERLGIVYRCLEHRGNRRSLLRQNGARWSLKYLLTTGRFGIFEQRMKIINAENVRQMEDDLVLLKMTLF